MGLNKFGISIANLKVSLLVKFTIGVTILIMVTALATGGFFLNHQKQIIYQSLRERGMALASNAAYNAEYGVLSINSLILADIVEGIMHQPDVAYCMVQDLNGVILASKGLSRQLLNSPQYEQAFRKAMNTDKLEIQLVDISRDMSYYDIGAPVVTAGIAGKDREEMALFPDEEDKSALFKKDRGNVEKIGVVRIGLSLVNAAIMVRRAAFILMFITLSIILISSLLAAVLIRIALLPIYALSEATQKISKGDFTYKIKVTARDEFGDLAYAFNKMVRDLQDSTVSIKVLRMEQKRFSDVADNSGDWIWEMDSEGMYVYTNRVVEKIMGYKPEEILGRYFYDFFVPQEREEMKKAVFKNFSKKEIFHNFLNRNVHKNGHVVIFETSAIPLVADNGDLISYRGVDRDITDRDRAEKEREEMLKKLKERQELLERQKQEVENSRMAIKNSADDLKESKDILEYQKLSLEATNKELDDFTYIVSHDLKEPLRSIDAYSKFIIDDYKDKLSEEGRHYLERVRANTERMKKLIEDLLEISRLKKRGNIIEEVETGELITEVKMRLEYAIKQKGVEIIIKDKFPKIFCDRVRLTEVFLNLISNAIKFDDKPKPIIELGYSDKGDMHEFYVKDNGIGIKEEYFNKIFEIFQRLGRKEDVEGTGAGLTIVKKIVQLHRGEIWLESKTGEGTVFYFTIPKEKRAILGKKLIGEILMEKKLVTKEDVKKALEEQGG